MSVDWIAKLGLGDIQDLKIVDARQYNDLSECHYFREKQSLIVLDGELVGLHLAEINSISELTLDQEASASLQYLKLRELPGLKKLSFKAAMPQLKWLEVQETAITRLKIPSGCITLEKAWLDNNAIQQFRFTDACPQLQFFDISLNPLEQLKFPYGFSSLHYVYATTCQLAEIVFENRSQSDNVNGRAGSQLKLQTPVPKLQTLHLANNRLEYVPENIILGHCLKVVYLEGNRTRNFPIDLIGNSYSKNTNCEPDTRVWFESIKHDFDAAVENQTVKLLLLGNSGAGKSTFVETFRYGECPGDKVSTHGIIIDYHSLDDDFDDLKFEYRIWDFGGQEVYHRTHRLFLASPALQLIVFDEKNEKAAREAEKCGDRHDPRRTIYNDPVPYWYETTKSLSPYSQFLIVQNLWRDEALDDGVARYAKKQSCELLSLNAKKGIGIDDARDSINALARQMPEYGMRMPGNWARVRDYFAENAIRCNDGLGFQIITINDFHERCASEGVKESARDALLKHLHNTGYLYYHKDLKDTIIADLRWALDIIYAGLKRDTYGHCELHDYGGRARKDKLFRLFGVDSTSKKTCTTEQKELLLSFMLSSNICFEYEVITSVEDGLSETQYVFPEFLPENEPLSSTRGWLVNRKISFRKRMDWVDLSQLHDVIVHLGRKTTLDSMWRYGICVQVSGAQLREQNDDTIDGLIRIQMDRERKELQVDFENESLLRWAAATFDLLGVPEDDTGWEVLTPSGDLAAFNPSQLNQLSQLLEIKQPEQNGSLSDPGLGGLEDVIKSRQEYTVLFFSTRFAKRLINSSVEYRSISEKIFRTDSIYQFRSPSVSSARQDSISQELILNARDNSNDVVHIVTHGLPYKKGGGLEFCQADGGGASEIVSVESFFNGLIGLKSKELPAVFLINSCYSHQHARKVSELGCFAIGYDIELPSTVAVRFAGGFYDVFCCQRNVEDAFRNAKNAARSVFAEINDCVYLFLNGTRVLE